MEAPAHSSSYFYVHKGHHSIHLQPYVDAYKKFIAVKVGAVDQQSNGGIFCNSTTGNMISKKNLTSHYQSQWYQMTQASALVSSESSDERPQSPPVSPVPTPTPAPAPTHSCDLRQYPAYVSHHPPVAPTPNLTTQASALVSSESSDERPQSPPVSPVPTPTPAPAPTHSCDLRQYPAYVSHHPPVAPTPNLTTQASALVSSESSDERPQSPPVSPVPTPTPAPAPTHSCDLRQYPAYVSHHPPVAPTPNLTVDLD
ncbi:pollen-specific leucine-rich repeat extensin-like protein 2 [Copidosoma floridanum]|uniref:pollen-specific leucine-rich repeat extensin-like protein 2 n=1 Tax=Copidosoma floridanum TaxID=29053 RepID=UPI000C6F613A|nr:pollen-specific leucine-rich repeat extensin-like protein 2 [Copidosoma floridanum]